MTIHFSTHTKFIRNFAIALLGISSSLLPAQAGDTYKWTVQYVIDNSQVVYGQPQKVWPRRNRGLAISPDGKFLYAGYHHSLNGQGEVRKLAVGITDDFARATIRVLPGPLGKAIATDDKGRVYIANQSSVLVYDENLSQLQFSFQTSLSEGIAVVREGNELALYNSERQIGVVRRWVLEEKNGLIIGAVPAANYGEDGAFLLQAARGLRGVEVDSKGRAWVADSEGGRVFRVSKDGKSAESVDLESAMDIGFDGDRAYVTRGTDRVISVLEIESMKVLGHLAIPWEELEVSPLGNNRLGALSGIAMVPGKGFFVSNENGQTADFKSTYGKADAHTDLINGKLYRDAIIDDNDPILQALIVPDAK